MQHTEQESSQHELSHLGGESVLSVTHPGRGSLPPVWAPAAATDDRA